jgi:hypothetical protein
LPFRAIVDANRGRNHDHNPMKSLRNLPEPPRGLGEHGQALWDAVQSELILDDAASAEVLCQACLCLDRAEQLAALIEQQGPTIKGPQGALRSNPLLRDELQFRALTIRTLQKLGVLFEPVKGMGKPSRAMGWRPDDEDD